MYIASLFNFASFFLPFFLWGVAGSENIRCRDMAAVEMVRA